MSASWLAASMVNNLDLLTPLRTAALLYRTRRRGDRSESTTESAAAVAVAHALELVFAARRSTCKCTSTFSRYRCCTPSAWNQRVREHGNFLRSRVHGKDTTGPSVEVPGASRTNDSVLFLLIDNLLQSKYRVQVVSVLFDSEPGTALRPAHLLFTKDRFE